MSISSVSSSTQTIPAPQVSDAAKASANVRDDPDTAAAAATASNMHARPTISSEGEVIGSLINTMA